MIMWKAICESLLMSLFLKDQTKKNGQRTISYNPLSTPTAKKSTLKTTLMVEYTLTLADDSADWAFSEEDYADEPQQSLTASQLVSERGHQVQIVAEVCDIPEQVAQALLNHFMWNKEKLLAAFMENPDKVYKDAKVDKVEKDLRMTQGAVNLMT